MTHRFNGAEAKKPRKCTKVEFLKSGYSWLQWGRGKKASEITTLTSWALFDSIASMGPRQKSLGNMDAVTLSNSITQASMGPRQKSLGNDGLYQYRPILRRCFNGAEAKKPRKLIARSVKQQRRICFNGAEAKKPRKSCQQYNATNKHSELQWGRGKKASEMITH